MATEDENQDDQTNPDIKLDITNGKHLEIDFDPREWIVIMIGVCSFAWITGLML